MKSSELYSQKNRIKEAHEIIRTLTILDTSIAYLDDPIIESNQLLLVIATQAKNITNKNKFIEKIHLYLFFAERDKFYKELTSYSELLETGINQAKILLSHLKSCVENLESICREVTDDAIYKQFNSIVSVNFLKIATIEQNISFAENQLKAIDKYRNVTLYHLNEALESKQQVTVFSNDGAYQELLDEFSNEDLKRNALTRRLFCIAFGAFYFILLNYLASTYLITWTSQKIRPVDTIDNKGHYLQQESFDVLNMISFQSLGTNFSLTMFILLIASFIGIFLVYYLSTDLKKAKKLFLSLPSRSKI